MAKKQLIVKILGLLTLSGVGFGSHCHKQGPSINNARGINAPHADFGFESLSNSGNSFGSVNQVASINPFSSGNLYNGPNLVGGSIATNPFAVTNPLNFGNPFGISGAAGGSMHPFGSYLFDGGLAGAAGYPSGPGNSYGSASQGQSIKATATNTATKPQNNNLIIEKKYQLTEMIGRGSFGRIWKALVINTDKEVAIKLEKDQPSPDFGLVKEAKILADLQGEAGFPKILAQGIKDTFNYRYMVMPILGLDMQKCLKLAGGNFSLKTTLMLADQIIRRLETLHNHGYVHRDIKPDNFMLGKDSTSADHLFLVDFGLSKQYVDSQGKHISFSENQGVTGTAPYASRNAHWGYELSRRDDLEAVGYLLLRFMGELPWHKGELSGQKVEGSTDKETYQLIAAIKVKKTIEELCQNLPKEFALYFKHVRSLTFEQTPNYKKLLEVFRTLFVQKGYDYDYKYDWSKLQDETQTNSSSCKDAHRRI